MTTDTTPTPATPRPRRAWGLARLAGVLGTGLLLGLLALLLGAGWWARSEGSLAQALQWAHRGWALTQAPGTTAPTSLTLEGMTGSLLRGGHIQRLRWQHNGLDIELTDLEARWPATFWWQAIRGGELHLDTLQAQTLRVQDDRPPDPEPLTPPSTLTLPWLQGISLPLRVQDIAVQWRQSVTVNAGPLQAHYQYRPRPQDGPLHELRIEQLGWAQGHYQAQLQLQAQTPLALHAEWQGQAPTHVPGGTAWTLALQGRVDGTLATPQARLDARLQVDGYAIKQPRNEAPPQLQAQATILPWANFPLHSGQLNLQNINLASLWPQAPVTRLQGQWAVSSAAPSNTPANDTSQAIPWQLQGELHNGLPGPWDRQALPLQTLNADLRWQADTWQLHKLQARLAGGEWQTSGSAVWLPEQDGPSPWWQRLGPWQGQVRANGIQPKALLSSLDLPPLNLEAQARTDGAKPGTLFKLNISPQRPASSAQTTGTAPSLNAAGRWTKQQLDLQQAEGQLWGAQLTAQGLIDLHAQSFDGALKLRLPGANATFDGTWFQGRHTTKPRDSQALFDLQDAEQAQRWLLSSWQHLDPFLPTRFGSATLPSTLRLGQLRGSAQLNAGWSGPAPTWPPSSSHPSPWHVRLQVPQLSWQDSTTTLQWQTADTELNANGDTWTVHHKGTIHLPDWTAQLALDGQAQWASAPRHPNSPQARLQLNRTELQARHSQYPWLWQLQTLQPTVLEWAGGSDLTLQAGQLQAQLKPQTGQPPATLSTRPLLLSWERSQWQQGTLRSRGQLQNLALSWLDAWLTNDSAPLGPMAQAGLQGDLLFNGDWDLALPLHPNAAATPAQARLRLAHNQGDLSLLSGESTRQEKISAGLSEASAQLELTGTALTGQLRWASQNAGQVEAQVGTTLTPPSAAQPQWDWAPSAPLQGKLQAQLPQVGLWSRLAPPGWRVRGRLQADATLAGTRSQPEWRGQLQADGLAVRSLIDGVEFSDGQLRATLAGDTIQINTLRLRGAGGEAGGWLTGSGSARWPARNDASGHANPQPEIDLTLQAQQLRLLARADRRLTLSGQLAAQLRGSQLDLSGRLQADQALFLLPDDSTPTLSDDVVVRNQATVRNDTRRQGTPVQTRLDVALLLGDNFRVRGRGLDTYLAGRLRLSSSPSQARPQLTGQVRTVRGTFRAYGQNLSIDEGTIGFNGPYDNPTLDILALRPHPTQKVGVQISGTAQAPRVRLYADPDLPDSEKLAWLVLGRPASGSGAQTAVLQQAAIALLSGQGSANDRSLSQALGLDELSYQGASQNTDGTTTAAAMTLGKRISNQLYVSYSRSVIGAVGTIAVLYDVSRYLTVRAQAGDDNALDVIFTHKYD